MRMILVAVVVSLQALPAWACDMLPGWKPPTPRSAYDAAAIVVHARVLTEARLDDPSVTIQVLDVLKGTFSGNRVENGSSCGARLKAGLEYVMFFRKGDGYHISVLDQPWQMTVAEILSALPHASSKGMSGALVPEPSRPTGQYFQLGYRGSRMPTMNDPEPSVNLQVDMGTTASCESRLALTAKKEGPAHAFDSESSWCTPTSASAQLKYHAVIRITATGKTVQLETGDIANCEAVAEGLLSQQAAGRKLELVVPCQAR